MRAEAVVAPPTARGQGQVLARTSFAFSHDARRAACLVRHADGSRWLQSWDLGGHRPRAAASCPVPDLPWDCQLLPLDDGRVLVADHQHGRHRLHFADPSGVLPWQQPAVPDGLGLRLLPLQGPGAVAAAVVSGPDGPTDLWWVEADGTGLRPAGRLPAPIAGAVAGARGSRLAVTLRDGTDLRPVLVDLVAGDQEPLLPDDLPTAERTGGAVRLLLADPGSGAAAWAVPGREGPLLVCRPSAEEPALPVARELVRRTGTAKLLAWTASGDLGIALNQGLRSEMVHYATRTGEISGVRLPPATLYPGAVAHGAGWVVPVATPAAPTEPVLVGPGPDRSWVTFPALGADHSPGSARLVSFPAAVGTVEAIVRGPGWQAGGPVVLALHGGPQDHWQLRYDPLLERLADRGACVVALNQRGSTGYGAAHAAAIRGAWGGPDLADVLAVGRMLRRDRRAGARAPALLGSSYGAFLALLAAAAEPESWSACAAVSAFSSGPALHAEASPAIRTLLDRLGGCVPVRDELGPRDVLALANRIRTPVLLVHGEQDEVIPVSHARHIHAALLPAAARHGHRTTLITVPGAGHEPLNGPDGAALTARVGEFLLS